MQKKVKDFVEAGQLGIFAKAYWGHPAYKLPPEANLMAVSHYLEALEWQRDVVKLHAIFGGKNPHPMFLVGGTPNPIDLESDSAVNAKKLALVQSIIDRMRMFVDQVYVPDTLAIAGFYKDWFERGEGLGNFLVFGDFPSAAPGTDLRDPASWWIPPGAIVDRNLSEVQEVDMRADSEIQEFVAHSWYDYDGGKDTGLHPWQGETQLDYKGRGGPDTPYRQLNVEDGYSWLKSPRWNGHSMEVGPLSRVLMLYATGNEQAKELVNLTLNTLDVPVTALFSTLGRTAARGASTAIGKELQVFPDYLELRALLAGLLVVELRLDVIRQLAHARQLVRQAGQPAHLVHLLNLGLEVLEGEAGTAADLLDQFFRLLLIDLALHFLHQREHVAHSEDT